MPYCPICGNSYSFAKNDLKAGRVRNECPRCKAAGKVGQVKSVTVESDGDDAYFKGGAVEVKKSKRRRRFESGEVSEMREDVVPDGGDEGDA